MFYDTEFKDYLDEQSYLYEDRPIEEDLEEIPDNYILFEIDRIIAEIDSLSNSYDSLAPAANDAIKTLRYFQKEYDNLIGV